MEVCLMNLLKSAAVAISVGIGAAHAQSISVEELRAQIDQRVGETNEYQALLTDPNPARAIAAMEIMMGSGDASLQRMAVEFGIFSTNPSVRAAALKAYLDARPTLSVFMTIGEAFEPNQRNYVHNLINRLGGTAGEGQEAFLSIPVGPYDSERGCYVYGTDERECLMRVNDQVASFRLLNIWSALTMTETGELVGAATPYNQYPTMDVRIPVTF
jgi:hypothetical protein